MNFLFLVKAFNYKPSEKNAILKGHSFWLPCATEHNIYNSYMVQDGYMVQDSDSGSHRNFSEY